MNRVGHPLVPLTVREINAVAEAVNNDQRYPKTGTTEMSNRPVFARIQLAEPPKYDVMQYDLGKNIFIPRRAEALVYEPTKAYTHVFTVLLSNSGNSARVQTHEIVQAIPGMDQYIYDPYTEFPVWRGSAPAQYKGPTVSEQIIENKELLTVLSERLYPGVKNAINRTRRDLVGGLVRPDYIGGFESFRESNDCDKCCQELVNADAPWKRYSAVFFRFYPGHPVYDESLEKQTPVYASGGVETGVGPGAGYYGSLARLEGLIVKVNVTDKKIEEYVDLGIEYVPDVKEDKIQRPKHGWRTDIKPMAITMPEGPSHTYDANTGLIQMDNWQMRLSWDYQNGVQLYGVKYSDTNINTGAEEVRTVLYKMGVTEDVVSYSVGNPMFRRNFTSADSSFYPVLRRLIKLERGIHVPNNATLVSIPLSDKNGYFKEGQTNVDLKDVVAIYEQDGDLINIFTGDGGPASRGRELVVRSIFSGLFYLWIFDYIFKQDGTIECKVEVTGRLVVALRNGQPSSPWANYVARNYAGLIHNHIYCYRLDFNIDYEHATDLPYANEVEIEESIPANNGDGCDMTALQLYGCENCEKCKNNSCCQSSNKNYSSDTSESSNKNTNLCSCPQFPQRGNCKQRCLNLLNPCGHGVLATHTHIHTEKDSITNINPLTNRTWAIKQTRSHIRMNNGNPEQEPIARGYAIKPAFNGTTSAQYWSWLTTHLGYAKSNFMATKYHPDEQYASGKFPILQPCDVGIRGRVDRNNQVIHDQDVVVWYTMPFDHTCHTEDFPFITLAPQSFSIVPHNFFEWNPASTIPPNRIN